MTVPIGNHTFRMDDRQVKSLLLWCAKRHISHATRQQNFNGRKTSVAVIVSVAAPEPEAELR